MADFGKVHGTPAAGAFYGLQFTVVNVAANSGVFTADSVDSTTKVITEGGYTKAVRAAEVIGSIVVLGARDASYFTAIYDGSTLDNGPGGTTSSAFGALIDAFLSEVNSGATYTVTTSTVLNGAGTFTFA